MSLDEKPKDPAELRREAIALRDKINTSQLDQRQLRAQTVENTKKLSDLEDAILRRLPSVDPSMTRETLIGLGLEEELVTEYFTVRGLNDALSQTLQTDMEEEFRMIDQLIALSPSGDIVSRDSIDKRRAYLDRFIGDLRDINETKKALRFTKMQRE